MAMNQKQKVPVDNAEEDGGELISLLKKKSNQKQKTSVNNAEEDGRELMLSQKKKLNICKHNTIHFQSLAYF